MQGITGAAPSSPELQSKYPVQSFFARSGAGLAPYLVPGGTVIKFAAIPSIHEIVRQVTTPNENLNVFQRTGKVATAGVIGGLTGKAFEYAGILPTVLSRVSARSVAGGVGSAIDSVAQDVESGREPDIHNALVNAAINSVTIGLLGAVVEVPALRQAVIREGSSLLGRSATFDESKAVLKKAYYKPGEIEKLSPVLKNAISEARTKSAIAGAKETATNLGVTKETVLGVYKARNVRDRLAVLDNEIYKTVKTATGRDPQMTPDGQQFNWDYSKMNPIIAERVQVLMKFRGAISQGASPADVLFNYEVSKKVSTKEYITSALKDMTRNIPGEYKTYLESNPNPNLLPVDFFAKGVKEIASSRLGQTEASIAKPSNSQIMQYLPAINAALDQARENEASKPPELQRNIPFAENLDPTYLREIVQEYGKKMEKGGNLESFLSDKFSVNETNPEHNFYVQTVHEAFDDEGKQAIDPATTKLFDSRNLRIQTITEAALNLKYYNADRKKRHLPEVKPDDIVFHKNTLENQKKGLALDISKIFQKEYDKAKIIQSYLPPSEDNPLEAYLPTPPTEPTAIDIAKAKVAQMQSPPEGKVDQVPTLPSSPIVQPSEDLQGKQGILPDLHELQNIAVNLAKTLGHQPSPEELAHAVGTNVRTLQDIMAPMYEGQGIEQPQSKGAYDEEAAKATEIPTQEGEVGSAFREDLPTGVNANVSEDAIGLSYIRDTLDEAYNSMSVRDIEQKLEDLKKRRSPKMQGRKMVFESLFLRTSADKSKEDIYGRWGFNHSQRGSNLDAKTRSYINSQIFKDVQEQIKNLHALAEGIKAQWPYYMNQLIQDLSTSQQLVSPQTWELVKDAILSLKDTSDADKVLSVLHAVKDAAKDLEGNIPWYEKDENIPFEGDDNDKPWVLGEKGTLGSLKSIPILKHTDTPRVSPTPLVVRWILNHPWVSKLNEIWETPQVKAKVRSKIREFFTVHEELHDNLFDYIKYQDAVANISREDLQPVLDDVLKNIQEHLKSMGVEKEKSKEVYLPWFDAYAELLHKAASTVVTNSYDPNNFAWSFMGNGPHKDIEERESYVKYVNKFYEKFSIPPSDRLPDGDPNNILPGTLRYSREGKDGIPVYWGLLSHPNVMKNESLHRAILFYKAQIETPLLENLMKLGKYASTDMTTNVLNGYAKSSFGLTGPQSISPEGFGRNPLEGPQGKKREIRTPEDFSEDAMSRGYISTDNFFTSALDYMQEGYRELKQYQLLSMFKKVELPALEYESEEFAKVLKENPTKEKFFWVQTSADINIRDEAKRISGILGREVHPEKILSEGGWVKGHEQGLASWKGAKFSPPWLYYTLEEETKTLFKDHDWGILGKLAARIQMAKFVFLSIPTDSVDQYLSNVAVSQPVGKILPYIAAVPFRKVYHLAKGLSVTGPSIIKGTYSGNLGNKTDYQYRMVRLLQEKGLVAAGGWKAYLASMFDKTDPGKFSQIQGKKEDIKDYFFSFFGTGEEVMRNFVEQDITNIGITMIEHQVSQGMSVEEAATFTASFLNSAAFMLNRRDFSNDLGFILKAISTSRNMAMTPLRVMLVMARLAGSGGKPPVFRTAATGGGEWMNTLLGSDIPARLMPAWGWGMLSLMVRVTALGLFSRFIIQSSIQGMATGELRGPWDNPKGAEWLIKMSDWTDVNGQQLYLDLGTDKMQRNIIDILATADPLIRMIPGFENVTTGRGILKFLQGKLGVLSNLNELSPFNTDTYNPDDTNLWNNVERFLKKSINLLPLNPYFGPGRLNVPLNDNLLADIALKFPAMFGYTLRPVKSQERQDAERMVRSLNWESKNLSREIQTEEQAREARDQGILTLQQMRGQFPKSDEEYLKANHSKLRKYFDRNNP
jgi:hypothetical protein